MIRSWMISKEPALLEWCRFPKGSHFTFLLFPLDRSSDSQFKNTVYLRLNSMCIVGSPENSIYPDNEYILSLPEITFKKAWMLCLKRPEVTPGNSYQMAFSKVNAKHMIIHSIEWYEK